MTPSERVVMEPPYNYRLDREVLTSDGATVSTEQGARADFKKKFDEEVFGRTYF